jgi:hypothetical protein
MAAGRKTGGRQKGSLNKATVDVKLAAQAFTTEAVETLANIMRTAESEAARVAAIKELLDRGHGKAKQTVDNNTTLTGPDGQPIIPSVHVEFVGKG